MVESVAGIVPHETRERLKLSDLEVTFRAESYWKDGIPVRTVPGDKETGEFQAFHHSLVREGDGRELVRARSAWRPEHL